MHKSAKKNTRPYDVVLAQVSYGLIIVFIILQL